jgi:hypothetical protein
MKRFFTAIAPALLVGPISYGLFRALQHYQSGNRVLAGLYVTALGLWAALLVLYSPAGKQSP